LSKGPTSTEKGEEAMRHKFIPNAVPFFVLAAVAVLLLVAGSSVSAQTGTVTRDPVRTQVQVITVVPDSGVTIPQDVTIAYQRVNVTIANQVATTHIDQLFVNNNDWLAEGTYLFPLPEGATVSQLTMWVDGVPIEAKILEKDEARAIYDAIVRQLRDPALLEYVGSSAIQANVFPIPPGDQRRIEIEYTQVLPADNGLVHYRFPQSTQLYTNTLIDSQSIQVQVQANEALRTVYSPSHRVAISRDGDFRAVVGYEEQNVRPDTDFDLFYSVSPEEIGLNLLTYRETGEDGFFLLLVTPGIDAGEVAAKDVLLVLDTSGSMFGEKMDQTKEAAQYVIDHLNPEDRFNIITFSTDVRSYHPTLLPAAEPGDYRRFIQNLEAIGGTNISQALLEALYQVDVERPTTIIFMTDGLANAGISHTPLLLEAIEQAAPPNVRLFAFGVGDDVDTGLLDGLANNHRGTTTYVRPSEAIDEAISSFYAKIQAPVLTDISLDFEGVMAEQLYPQTLPDLFAGGQLVLAGRYRDGGPATIKLQGTVNGRLQTFTYDDQFFRHSGGEAFIPRLWATRAIGQMLTQMRLHGEDQELVQSVVDLSIRYGIITPYTSYLIEEDDIFSQTARETIVQNEVADREAAEPQVSGSTAVQEAVTGGQMAAAEAPAAPERIISDRDGRAVAVEEVVQVVGDKTFVWRNGRWVDTVYQPESHAVEQIDFAADAYFDLVTALPRLGRYLALGQNVLIVHEGAAYEITGSPTEASSQAAIPAALQQLTGEPGGLPGTDRAGTDSAPPSRSNLPLVMVVVLLLITAVLFLVNRFR
jgi:Ca-activated chloride channel homolog